MAPGEAAQHETVGGGFAEGRAGAAGGAGRVQGRGWGLHGHRRYSFAGEKACRLFLGASINNRLVRALATVGKGAAARYFWLKASHRIDLNGLVSGRTLNIRAWERSRMHDTHGLFIRASLA
ncbi:hypothetical protein PCAU_0197 [Pseudomonas chlororaphis subsp. aurantiaca]|nr:hypothetical protein PCAU_0197 [Pseudomonas chlororaphis subsp. aurantiaca]